MTAVIKTAHANRTQEIMSDITALTLKGKKGSDAMAHIDWRGDVARIRVYKGKDAAGKAMYESKSYRPKATTPAEREKEVSRFAAEFEELVKNGGILEGEKMTVREFGDRYWTDWMDFQRGMEMTRKSYEDILRLHVYPAIGYMKISSVTSLHLQEIVNSMHRDGLSRSAMHNTIAAASSLFSCAVKKRVINSNPCDSGRIDYPKVVKEDKLHYYTVEQANRFLDALEHGIMLHTDGMIRKNGRPIPEKDELKTFDQQFLVYFSLAIFGGFRRGEMVALRWPDVNFKDQTISIQRAARRIRKEIIIKEPKTESGKRTIVLPKICFDRLRNLQKSRRVMSPDGWIFVQRDGITMMDPDTPGKFFRNFLQTYNMAYPDNPLPVIRLHDLRHTAVTLLLSNGVDIYTAMERVGHSKPTTTMEVYGHVIKEYDRKASDLLEKLFKEG